MCPAGSRERTSDMTSEIRQSTIRERLTHPLPRARVPGIPQLSLATRFALLVAGWSMVLLALVGAVLPVLQGWVFLVLGAATLSLVSRTVLSVLRFLLRPWPKAWRALLRTRRRVHRWILRRPTGGNHGEPAERP